MRLIEILEAGRKDFLDATRDIPPEHSSAKPSPESWSVLECIEHVVTVESRCLDWISVGAAGASERGSEPNPEKETRIFTTVRSRLTKVKAPEVVSPRGRFDTMSAALVEFKAVRDRCVQMVEERGTSLYSVGANHPFFGNLNGVELVHFIDGHARRHADQIRETREAVIGKVRPSGGV